MEYAEYLHKIKYWPRHDALAAKQGKLILKYLAGDKSVVAQIAALAKEIDEYRESFYYNPVAGK